MNIGSFFLEHPRSVGEGYWQHMRVALSYAGWLGLAAACALAHAFAPALFTRTAGDIITKLNARMAARRAG